MDIFLVLNGIVQNIVVVDSMDSARVLFPGAQIYERTEQNQHLNIGDVYAVPD